MKSKGFTLIELLIVLTIICIFAVFAMNAWNGKNDQSIQAPLDVEVGRGAVVSDQPDLSSCEFAGLDASDRSVFKCSDGRLYTK